MMSTAVATLGAAPIVDFDGTIAYLPVDWAALRRELRVGSIGDLWRGDGSGWDTVAAAELEGVRLARPIPATMDALAASVGFVVITDNDESAVTGFLAGFPALAAKVLAVIGRRSHGGPKRDPEVFVRAFHRAAALVGEALIAAQRPAGPHDALVYCGDQEYELELAAALGARTVRVSLIGELHAHHPLDLTSPGTR